MEAGYTFEPVDDDASLIEAGFIDSVNIVGLTLELEDKFHIRIPAPEMTPENWTSVRAIAAMCVRIQQSGSGPNTESLLWESIYGSRSIQDLMRTEIARAGRHAHSVSFLVFRLGHLLQDPDAGVIAETWVEIERAMAGNLRIEDSVSMVQLPERQGGILGVLPHTLERSVYPAIDRIGRMVQEAFGKRYNTATVEFGLATFPADGTEVKALIQKACGSWRTLQDAAGAAPREESGAAPLSGA